MYFLYVTRAWTKDARFNLMAARIKRFFRNSLGPEPLTEAEEDCLARFHFPATFYPVNSSMDAWQQRKLRGDFKVNKKALKKAVRAVLDPVCGQREEDSDPDALVYTLQCPSIEIRTFVDFGARIRQLTCVQSVPLLGHHFCLGLLGLLGWNQTYWNGLDNADIEDTASLLARQCAYMNEAIPVMFKEITTQGE